MIWTHAIMKTILFIANVLTINYCYNNNNTGTYNVYFNLCRYSENASSPCIMYKRFKK